MKKLVVHIGYMKTATTSLQLNVFTPLMKKGKIEYLNHTSINDSESLGKFSIKNTVSYILGNSTEEKIKNELGRLSGINKDISLLSNENISCFSEKYPTTSSHSGAPRNAEKTYNLFSSYFDKIEIVVTVREQTAMIISFYTQVYSTLVNFDSSWKDMKLWFNDTFSQRNEQGLFLDYHAMFTAYAQFFGRENVHVLVYEDLLHDKQSFYQKLAKVLEVDQTEIATLFEATVQNKTRKVSTGDVQADPGDLHAKLFAIAHKIFRDKDSRVFKAAKKTAKALIPDKILKTRVGSGAKIRKLTDEEQTFISELFNDSNSSLIQEAGLDKEKMMQYGYI